MDIDQSNQPNSNTQKPNPFANPNSFSANPLQAANQPSSQNAFAQNN